MPNRRDLLIGCAALASLVAPGRSGAAGAQITLLEQRGRYLTQVRLNGGAPYRFVLDTGSSTHFISSAIAARLRLPTVDVTSIRSFGGRSTETIVALNRLDVGGVAVGDTRAVAWDAAAMEGHDGLVGYPILGQRALLDLAARRLNLVAPRPASDAVEVDARVSANETLLIGGVDGAEGRFVFDTGSAQCVISRPYLARLRETDAFAQAEQVINATAQGRTRLLGLRLPELRFGGLVLDRPFVRIADPDASPEMFHQVDALLGAELLRRCAWTLDRGRRTLHAQPPAA
jgi:predicted aspartyl protease